MKIDPTKKIGTIANPYPAGTVGGDAKFSNAFYFKAGAKPDNYNEDQVSQFTASGERRGRTAGSSNGGYVLPAGLLKSAPAVAKFVSTSNDTVEAGKERRKWSANLGLSILATFAPALVVEVGGSPAREVARRMTGAEIKSAMKEAGIKPGSDEAFDWMADNNNLMVKEQVAAIPPGQFTIGELVSKGAEITLQPGQVARLAEMTSQAIRDAAREFNSEKE